MRPYGNIIMGRSQGHFRVGLWGGAGLTAFGARFAWISPFFAYACEEFHRRIIIQPVKSDHAYQYRGLISVPGCCAPPTLAIMWGCNTPRDHRCAFSMYILSGNFLCRYCLRSSSFRSSSFAVRCRGKLALSVKTSPSFAFRWTTY